MSKTLKQKLSKIFWQNSCQKRQKIDKKVIKNCQLKWSDNKQVSTILVTTIWVPRASTYPKRVLWVEMEFYTDIEINVHFFKILLVFEIPYWPRVKGMPGKS